MAVLVVAAVSGGLGLSPGGIPPSSTSYVRSALVGTDNPAPCPATARGPEAFAGAAADARIAVDARTKRHPVCGRITTRISDPWPGSPSRAGRVGPKAGATGSVHDLVRDRRLNHRVEVVGGVLEAEGGDVLREFFAQRR